MLYTFTEVLYRDSAHLCWNKFHVEMRGQSLTDKNEDFMYTSTLVYVSQFFLYFFSLNIDLFYLIFRQ